LTAYTHLFIPATQEMRRGVHQELRLLRAADASALLPGSSLKGVLRGVAEAISGSCLTLPLGRRGEVGYRGRAPINYRIPEDFEHCRDAGHLCPACRLFGSLSDRHIFFGKMSFSDAVASGAAEVQQLTLEALMEPKPRHRAWYEDPQQRGYMRGRKFYYHRPGGPRTTAEKTQYNKTVEAVKPGTVFEFSVDYANLTQAELALLIYAVTLEPGMCHKVGMGKPIGMGSARIEITGWQVIDRQARYRQLGGGVDTLDGDVLAAEITRRQAAYHEEYALWAESLADLRRIWAWTPGTGADVRYPDQDWFRKNQTAPIDQAP
jgi:CRISPR-associated protein (TIGR03986 family)